MYSMSLPIFPTLLQELRKQEDSDFSKEAIEHINNINYHYDFMFESKVGAQLIATSIEQPWLKGLKVHFSEQSLRINNSSLIELARYGDMSIREAATTIDCALLLTNFVTGISILQNKMAWTTKDPKHSLKDNLKRINTVEGRALSEAISKVMESIGYDLMRSYRNWVTHRGAPQVCSKQDWTQPISYPAELARIQDTNLQLRIVQEHVKKLIYDNVTIACAAFYPNIRGFLTTKLTEENNPSPNDFKISGGGSITFADVKIRTANLLEKNSAYLASHTVDIAEGQTQNAGENLTVYKIEDYLSATNHIATFTWECLSGDWDKALAEFYLANK